MSKSLLLATLIAAVALATCAKSKAQTQGTPPIPAHELEAVKAACENGGTVLHFLHRETEGERQAITKIMFCIDKRGKQVLRIECSYGDNRCQAPIATQETVQEFRRLLRSMGDRPTELDT